MSLARTATPSILPFPARPAPRLHLSPPHLAGTELEGLRAALDSGWLAPAGPVPAAFEAALALQTGFPAALATVSGTAALHLGFRLLGVGPGDEVWAPALTFVATIAPAVQMGAQPRFLDSGSPAFTLDPAHLAEELAAAANRGRLPRAVVPVDLYGQPCDMDGIAAAAARWGVPVISDSAAALGATQRGGRHAGRGARLAVLSFNGNKIVTTGGGGALLAEDPALIAAARKLAGQAREPVAHFEHETTGYAYGLSSVLAAIGLAQLSALAARVERRREIFAGYAAGLADLPGVDFLPEPAWSRANRWLTVVTFDPPRFGADREAVRHALDAAGIESRPAWKPLHLQPAFRDAPHSVSGRVARFFADGLCLPSGSGLSGADQARVIEVIRGCARA
jgi:dTDP-4-amino-4,6-dideoxygalactose transaminase